ncbi:beta-ketoacyl synthase N-terminal-like domain-containing protein [Streptomyces sp. CA-250714]|uniref:beta-ketoacyl synthase N-terminal-like domain-containing protein n=1 Tax=Streptomyces sp. CA-250714 TaxID=3240060 RepID=UPI003D93D690
MTGVVVTGIGALTSAGLGHEVLRQRAAEGAPARRDAVRTLPAPPGQPQAAPVRLAALPPYDPAEHLGRRGLRTLSAESKAFGVAAVNACRHAGLPGSWEQEPSVGVAAGTTSGGLEDYAALFATRLARGVRGVNPAQGPQTGLNAPASAVSILTGAAGPNLTLSTGRAAALDALAAAARAIASGAATTMLAGGVQLFGHAELTARRRAGQELGPGGPGAEDGAGFGTVAGEAAVVLVLEDAQVARARGARPLARVLGAGSAFGPAATRPGQRAAHAALDEAGVAHTAPGAPTPPVFPAPAVDAAFGDCAGATGAVQAALTVLGLHHGAMPDDTALVLTVEPAPTPEPTASREPAASPQAPTAPRPATHTEPGGYAAALVLGTSRTGTPSTGSTGPSPEGGHSA